MSLKAQVNDRRHAPLRPRSGSPAHCTIRASHPYACQGGAESTKSHTNDYHPCLFEAPTVARHRKGPRRRVCSRTTRTTVAIIVAVAVVATRGRACSEWLLGVRIHQASARRVPVFELVQQGEDGDRTRPVLQIPDGPWYFTM